MLSVISYPVFVLSVVLALVLSISCFRWAGSSSGRSG